MTTIRFLGVAGFEVVGPQQRVLLDPFLTGNPLSPISPDEIEAPDVILVTHGAWNHLGDAAAIARRTGAPVVCGADVEAKLLDEGVPQRQIQPTTWGLVVRIAGLDVRPVECHHWSSVQLSDGTRVTGTPMAFIFETEPGVRIYHYGDTCIFDMSLIGRLYRPTVGLLGCTDPSEIADVDTPGKYVTGEMTPDEAAMAAGMLGVDLAIACHYLGRNDDVDDFLRFVPQHDTTGRRVPVALEVGETYEVQGSLAGSHAPADGGRPRLVPPGG